LYPQRQSSKEILLITGSSGLVGSYFLHLVDLAKYHIFELIHSEEASVANRLCIDLSTSFQSLQNLLSKVKPDIIINLAAMTNVDQCEAERRVADNINHLSLRELASYIMKNRDCYLLHVSTDYVFDGEKGDYNESDSPNPVNWYGMTKFLGEQELVKSDPENWCIVRTSTPFGIHQKKVSFPLFVLTNLSQRHEIRALSDQVTSPTYAYKLAETLLEIIAERIRGILHVTGSSQISRFNQALEIAAARNLDTNLIKPISIKEMQWKAARPRNSSLNVKRVCSILKNKPLSFSDSLSEFFKELD
jgi:dTDP-4-dehydrorhamnose reductase